MFLIPFFIIIEDPKMINPAITNKGDQNLYQRIKDPDPLKRFGTLLYSS
jgi:hypothetical protein